MGCISSYGRKKTNIHWLRTCSSSSPGPKGFQDKWSILPAPHFLSMYNGRYNISNYAEILVLANDVVPCGCTGRPAATCRRCPNVPRPICQSVHSATSAPLIEIFMWRNCDLNCENVAAVQMCFPIKSSLQKLFLQQSEAKLFNQRSSSYAA